MCLERHDGVISSAHLKYFECNIETFHECKNLDARFVFIFKTLADIIVLFLLLITLAVNV